MQEVVWIETLPADALEAASRFHAVYLDLVRQVLAGKCDSLAIVFPPAPYDHRGWRTAIVADLARAHTPQRVNGVIAEQGPALAATLDWLAGAAGVTGQLLACDGQMAENTSQ